MTADIVENLRKAILEYNTEAAAIWARKAIEAKIEPARALDAMTEAIREIGDGFDKGDLFLPDLVGAADAMLAAQPIIEERIMPGSRHESLGQVVIGTVYGDIHTIGKTMVATLLVADGFTIHDMGINVTAEEFIEGTKRYKPDILAMSALLTTSAREQRKVIEALEREGLRDKVKIMVGGGAITEEFAASIGANGYASTAPKAVKLARKLLEGRH